MPVGEPGAVQIAGQGHPARRGATISEEHLGAVRFVPLIGAEGWDERGH